jgi:hypothetical protein
MLQINNMLHAPAEAKHSLDQIMKSATALPAVSRVNNGKNVGACCNLEAGIREIGRDDAT